MIVNVQYRWSVPINAIPIWQVLLLNGFILLAWPQTRFRFFFYFPSLFTNAYYTRVNGIDFASLLYRNGPDGFTIARVRTPTTRGRRSRYKHAQYVKKIHTRGEKLTIQHGTRRRRRAENLVAAVHKQGVRPDDIRVETDFFGVEFDYVIVHANPS